MATISKYVKLDRNILMEYIYNDDNYISEPYNILINTRTKNRSFMSGDTSATNNISSNQLFCIDNVLQRYGNVDLEYYSNLQVKNYGTATPICYDTIKIHLPITWTFGEYYGFYLRLYCLDKTNTYTYDLANYYFDMSDVNQQYMLNFDTTQFMFDEQLWGKSISLQIPSPNNISKQTTGNKVKENSINANLTNYNGLSISSPIFIDFRYIRDIQTLNGEKIYYLSNSYTTTIPQTPEFEKLGLVIKHSDNGDFFEIYGTYADTIYGFNQWIQESLLLGHKYYVQYDVTLYEQNIRGKTITFTQLSEFNSPIEYRPIIKYSTTTAIINVEMKVIDSVDESTVIRNASYGMLQDEVSKYSLKLTKINMDKPNKPKIYNVRSEIDYDLIHMSSSFGNLSLNGKKNNKNGGNGYGDINRKNRTITITYPILINNANIVASSDNVTIGKDLFYGRNNMMIELTPFDNMIKFTIAQGDETSNSLMDLTSYSDIKFIIKNYDTNITDFEYTMYTDAKENNLKQGRIVFKIPQSDYNGIKNATSLNYKGIFYIVYTNMDITSVLYSGAYVLSDSQIQNQNIIDQAEKKQQEVQSSVILDDSMLNATAIVTRKKVADTDELYEKQNQANISTVSDTLSTVGTLTTSAVFNNNISSISGDIANISTNTLNDLSATLKTLDTNRITINPTTLAKTSFLKKNNN